MPNRRSIPLVEGGETINGPAPVMNMFSNVARTTRRVQEIWDVNGYQVQTTVLLGDDGYRGKWYLVLSEDNVQTGDAPLVYNSEQLAVAAALKAAIIAMERTLS